MRSEERQAYILKYARKNGFVSIPKTAETLEISVETVRRDVNALCSKNLLRKVHGGAAPIKAPIRKDPDYHVRIQQNQQEKIAIGKAAAACIRNGDVVALDYGVTMITLASCIDRVQDVTFVVNSLPVAMVLLDKLAAGDITGQVIIIGGVVNPKSRQIAGMSVLDEADKYHFDLAFVGCTSLSVSGAAQSSLDAASYSAHLIKNAAASVLLADSDKVGKNSVCSFAEITDFDRIIVDNKVPCPSEILEQISGSNTQLTVVDCTGKSEPNA